MRQKVTRPVCRPRTRDSNLFLCLSERGELSGLIVNREVYLRIHAVSTSIHVPTSFYASVPKRHAGRQRRRSSDVEMIGRSAAGRRACAPGGLTAGANRLLELRRAEDADDRAIEGVIERLLVILGGPRVAVN